MSDDNSGKKPGFFNSVAGLANSLKDATETAIQNASAQLNQSTQAKRQSGFPAINAGSAYCPNCGTQISGAKFCPGCGTPAAATSLNQTTQQVSHPIPQTPPPLPNSLQSDQTGYSSIGAGLSGTWTQGGGLQQNGGRTQEYSGAVLKCPHCGAPITHTTAICPECNSRLAGRASLSSVQTFNEQMMAIESTRVERGFFTRDETIRRNDASIHEKKLTLISTFPIPNTIDDVYEFLMLAISNIDIKLSKKPLLGMFGPSPSSDKEISDAWVKKLQQIYKRAEISFPQDPIFVQIKDAYESIMIDLNLIKKE